MIPVIPSPAISEVTGTFTCSSATIIAAMIMETDINRRKKLFSNRSSRTRLRFRTGFSQRRLSFDASTPTIRIINAPIHCRAWLIKNSFIASYWGISRPSLLITGKVHCDIKTRKPSHTQNELLLYLPKKVELTTAEYYELFVV